MKENKYDEPAFFDQYSQMSRSVQGLKGAGEWHELKKILPDFKGKRVLDLGCGFGWHCRYAVEQGARSVVGIDISEKMLSRAKQENGDSRIQYLQLPIEEAVFAPGSFEIVISSLAFHYLDSFEAICEKVCACLTSGGHFVFSVEHPVFTAYGTEDWIYDEARNILHWPVDQYYIEGLRKTRFCGESVIKYHRTLTTYLQTLLNCGFEIFNVIEPQPSVELLAAVPDMKNELRRPMMLLVSAIQKETKT